MVGSPYFANTPHDPMTGFSSPLFRAVTQSFVFCIGLFGAAVFAQESFDLKLADGTVASGHFKDMTLVLTDREGTERAVMFAELHPFVRDRLVRVLRQETDHLKAGAEIGKITAVIDGDTFRFRGEDGKARTIRLYQIDAPESNQPFGEEASAYLAGLVKGKTVSIIVRRRDDRYGRDIADLYVDDLWVVGRLVENGYAWNYTTYSDSEELAAREKQARKANAACGPTGAPSHRGFSGG
ncbi:MAG TPA: hypothetical protein DEB39_06230 [Planctomycetaceae bacterium]|nr:hypothetical protein [Planctomycetaceae bacterium]